MTSALDQKGPEAAIAAGDRHWEGDQPSTGIYEAAIRAYLSTTPAEIAEVVERVGYRLRQSGLYKDAQLADELATLIERLAASQAETRRLALEEAAKLRTGDHVYHIPSGETWVVAWADYESGDMAPCGWPESMARISDCAVLEKADDAESAELVESLSKSGRRDAHRAARIRSLIDQPATDGGKDV